MIVPLRPCPWLLAAAGMAVAAPAQDQREPRPAEARAAEARPRTGPIVYADQGALYIDVQVKGKPVRFLLDTGASRSALSEDFARKLELPLRDGGEVEGTAG